MTKYYCDMCKTEIDDTNLQIRLSDYKNPDDQMKIEKHICRTCMTKLLTLIDYDGLWTPHIKPHIKKMG